MNVDYRLCNVLFSDGNRSKEYPDLYVKCQMGPHTSPSGAVELSHPGHASYDFATYFRSEEHTSELQSR